MINEPPGNFTFRIGLFGLDKLQRKETTIKTLEATLDRILAGEKPMAAGTETHILSLTTQLTHAVKAIRRLHSTHFFTTAPPATQTDVSSHTHHAHAAVKLP